MTMRLTLTTVAFLFGCNNSNNATPPTTGPNKTETSSQNAVLKPIELHYGVYLLRLDLRVTISADGTLRSVQTDNKSYGGNDIDAKYERVEIREGRLTKENIADLTRLFAKWDSLSSKPYGGVPDGGEVYIRYGDKTVSGGSEAPQQITDVRVRVTEMAQSMMVVNQ